MAENPNDKPPRSAADKERSRQMSRSVSGRDAARTVGGGNRRTQQPPPGRGAAKGGKNQRQGPPGRDGQGRPQAGGGRAAPARSSAGGGRNTRPGQRPGQRPRQAARRPTPRGGQVRTGLFIWGSIVLVVVIVGILVGINLSSTKPNAIIYSPKPVPAKVLSEITHVPTSVYNSVGTGISGAIATPRPETGQKLLEFTGKPGLLGLFGEFCPYCAAERWAIITSFSRFGSFSGLQTMQSSPVDVDPKTQTFTFKTAKYSSPYFTARLVEYFGQDYNKTGAHKVISKLTKQEQKLIVKFDRSSTTSSTSGGLSIPFMDIGNKLVAEGVSFTPRPLQGLSRTTIAAGLATAKNAVTQLIIGSSNYLSASICSVDGGKPGSVCQSAGVQAAAKAMKLST